MQERLEAGVGSQVVLGNREREAVRPQIARVSTHTAGAISDDFLGPFGAVSDLWMKGNTPPPAMVARTRMSSSSSPRMASCRWRGVMRFTRRSFVALPRTRIHIGIQAKGRQEGMPKTTYQPTRAPPPSNIPTPRRCKQPPWLQCACCSACAI
jgi:hypothetical protein